VRWRNGFHLKLFVENNFGIVFILFFALGFIIPGLDLLHPAIINVFLALVIFFSCPKIIWSDFGRGHLAAPAVFYILRFLIFPACLFWGLNMILPTEYAIAALLLALSPAGVSALPLSILLGGNSVMALILVVGSFALCPFVLPAILSFLGFSGVHIDPVNMGFLLLLIIFLPTFIYFSIFKKYIPRANQWIDENGSFWSAIFIGAMVMLIVAQRKEYFFIDFTLLWVSVLLLCFVYGTFYIFGWLFAWTMGEDKKISYAVASGANSNSVGLAIGFLYFSPEVGVIMAVGEIPWILLVFVFETFVRKRKRPKNQS
jgi:predicted Na+-dependent transporter